MRWPLLRRRIACRLIAAVGSRVHPAGRERSCWRRSPRPPRVFGIGLNYLEHAAESNMKVQAVPTVFIKLSSSVVGPESM